MEEYSKKILSYVGKNKIKFIFLILFFYIILKIVINYITLPGKIDFFINGKYYQDITKNMTIVYPETRTISYDAITFYNPDKDTLRVRESCRNKSSYSKYYIENKICNEKYNILFNLVKKSGIIWATNFNINDDLDWQNWAKYRSDSQIQILTNSFFSRILDTSYIYSKGYFKEKKNLPKNYIEIINDDWAVYQDLN